MFVLHIPYALQHAAADCITQILCCCLWMNVAEVDGPVSSPGDTEPLRCKGRIRAKSPEAANTSVDGTERCRSRLCDKRLGRNSLGCLCCSLLRLGDVRATVFAIVDPLSGPRGFRGERVHNLKNKPLIHMTSINGGIVPLWRQICSKSVQSRYSCHGRF